MQNTEPKDMCSSRAISHWLLCHLFRFSGVTFRFVDVTMWHVMPHSHLRTFSAGDPSLFSMDTTSENWFLLISLKNCGKLSWYFSSPHIGCSCLKMTIILCWKSLVEPINNVWITYIIFTMEQNYTTAHNTHYCTNSRSSTIHNTDAGFPLLLLRSYPLQKVNWCKYSSV